LSSRRVQFVTGHNVDGVLPEDLNFPALADPLATTVVFMGQRTFPKFSERLFAEGLPTDTPALLAEAVSKPEQTLRFTTVGALADDLAKEVSPKPALILYGPLAQYDEADG
jgi:uroporphyrin-III C-methyltransferase